MQAIWEARAARGGSRASPLAALAARSTSASRSWWVNVNHGADPREFLVSTQSSTEVKEVADQVLALAASRGPGKPPLTVTVDAAEGATFPYAWYFRHLAAGYIDYSQPPTAPPTSDVLDAHRRQQDAPGHALDGYDGRQFEFRVWWVRDYGISRPPTR